MKTQARQDDPFLLSFLRMIKEEESICERQNQSNFNQQLRVELKTIIKDYVGFLRATDSDQTIATLSKIYDLIMQVNEIPMIKEQINAVKKYQHRFLTSNEHHVDIYNAIN
jgi:ribosomal protein S20